MTDVIQKELIPLPGESLPHNMVASELWKYKQGEVTDLTNKTKDIYFFSPDDGMPTPVAEWLRYRSLSESSIAVDNEADRYRFKDVDEIKEKFLSEQTGRSLFVAVGQNDRRLYGSAWVHQLQGNAMDYQLTNVALEYAKKFTGQSKLNIQNTATFATREYAESYRKGLAIKLGMFAINNYFEQNENCFVVVGRYSASDNFQTELIDGNVDMQARHRFQAISQGLGWVVYGSIRPSLR